MPKPKGNLAFVRCEFKQKGDIALYARFIFKDENGVQFYFKASTFLFDMKVKNTLRRKETE